MRGEVRVPYLENLHNWVPVLKCLYINTNSHGTEQEELQVCMQLYVSDLLWDHRDVVG